ncbi:MAG TPA: NAD(P)-dependent oxidoreductase, partial [Candidatus Kapabacteria bacterium]|nr:NAD(P)-dependent oxidoreductase [Candidatus Kapabacteria bacterium]
MPHQQKLHCAFYSIPKDMKPYLRQHLKGMTVTLSEAPLTKDNLDLDANVLGVFVDSTVTKEMIDLCPKLELILTMSTGYDHIDLVAAKKRHIPVCNVPTYGENTVAEHAMALILALSRRLFESVQRVKEGVFDYHGLRGFDIKGKTIGVIGTGRIGLHL